MNTVKIDRQQVRSNYFLYVDESLVPLNSIYHMYLFVLLRLRKFFQTRKCLNGNLTVGNFSDRLWLHF